MFFFFSCIFFSLFVGFFVFFFFFQAEDGIRYGRVTGVQTCALPIFRPTRQRAGGHLSLPEIAPVSDGRGLSQFIAFPYDHYRGDPLWVPQLRMDVRTLLTPAKNPFFRSEERRVGRACKVLEGLSPWT